MGWESWLTLAVLVGALSTLVLTRYAADVILGAGVVILLVFGVLTPGEAVHGLANTGTATVAVLFVVAHGLYRSGVVSWLTEKLLGRPKRRGMAQLRLMLPVSFLSSVMNNTPVVAMMIPAVTQWAKRLGVSISQLMIPLSYSAIVGGLCTTVGTSTNLVVNEMLLELGTGEQLQLFELAWVGIPAVFVTIVFILIFSRMLLPSDKRKPRRFSNTRRYVIEMLVEEDGPLVGKTVAEAELRQLPSVYLVEIVRGKRVIPAVTRREMLYPNDRLVFAGDVENVVELKNIRGLCMAEEQVFKLDSDPSQRALVEAVVSPQFPYLGRTVRESQFRQFYGAAIIAIARDSRVLRRKIGDVTLKRGDTLLLEAPREFEDQQRYSRDFMLVSGIDNSSEMQHAKAGTAAAILLAMVIAVGVFDAHILSAGLVALMAMIFTRCLSVSEAHKSVDVSVILVIAASISLGTALDKTGVAATVATGLVSLVGDSPMAALTIMFVLTAGFSAIVSNLATAVMLFPVAVAISAQMGVSMVPFAVILMVGASASFATPIGYQTNLMVYGPGNYQFNDFVKIGVPLTILVGCTALWIVPQVWPF